MGVKLKPINWCLCSLDNLDNSLLTFASQEGHTAVVKFLLEAGADMNTAQIVSYDTFFCGDIVTLLLSH